MNKNEEYWYTDFWKRLNQASKLDVITLNYDSTIQNTLGSLCTDGYKCTDNEKIQNFAIEELYKDDKSKVLNLHGSILLGYSISRNINVNRYIYTDEFHDLYKYPEFFRSKRKLL